MPRRDLTYDDITAVIADPHDQIITIREAAQHAGVTPEAVQTWITNGCLPATVVNGRSWVAYSHVIAVEKRKRDTPGGRPRGFSPKQAGNMSASD